MQNSHTRGGCLYFQYGVSVSAVGVINETNSATAGRFLYEGGKSYGVVVCKAKSGSEITNSSLLFHYRISLYRRLPHTISHLRREIYPPHHY